MSSQDFNKQQIQNISLDIDQLDRLIEKYSVSGPRYTSYPTALEFKESYAAANWLDSIRADAAHLSAAVPEKSQRDTSSSYSLYFHIPFCPQLCYFCACNKIISKNAELHRPYLDTLINELKLYRNILGDTENLGVEQIHWGGGTPNSLSPQNMEYLHENVLKVFPKLLKDADVSIEIDPRTTTKNHLATLRQLGFNRISLGVQDFNEAVQTIINRLQPYEMTSEVIAEGRRQGFGSVNIDLIYGLPNQTLEGFEKTLAQVLELRPERIALYGYAHVTWIKKVQKALERAHLPTPKERVQLFLKALECFQAAGYRYIGMDHFALPSDSLSKALEVGKLNRNFMGYSSHRGARLLGFGVSSISSLPSAFGQNSKELAEYQNKINSGELAHFRGLDRSIDDRRRGEIIETLLCQGTLDIQKFENFWGIKFFEEYASAVPELKQMAQDELLTFDSSEIRLTAIGRVLSRNVAMIFDSYLTLHRATQQPRFSQAV